MIVHVDMDAFYASVEQRDDPGLRGRAVVVGGTSGRGVVCAASYEARRYGVHSAMPVAQARRLCPQAVLVAPRMKHYARISQQVHEILAGYTPVVEPLSLDEAFLDVRGSVHLFGSIDLLVSRLQREIRERLELPASVGAAPVKFVAKIASDLRKPRGLVVVQESQVLEFLARLPVERLWGVGERARRRLASLGVHRVGDLRLLPVSTLREQLGAGGEQLWRLARGEDGRPVIADAQAKSLSHETTFPHDIGDREVLRAVLLDLTEQVARRLRRQQARAGTAHLKFRSSAFQTWTRSQHLPDPTDGTESLWEAASQLLARVPEQALPLRLLGFGVSGLDRDGRHQQFLFDQQEREKQSRLDVAADAIRDRFGAAALRRATAMRRRPERPEGR